MPVRVTNIQTLALSIRYHTIEVTRSKRYLWNAGQSLLSKYKT